MTLAKEYMSMMTHEGCAEIQDTQNSNEVTIISRNVHNSVAYIPQKMT